MPEPVNHQVWRLAWLTADGKKLLLTRALRSFGYGNLAVIVALYLAQLGLDPVAVGVVLTAAVAGSTVLTIAWALVADRYGRRKTVATMALLMMVGGLLFAIADQIWLLLLGAFTGTISATSSEVGPFNTVEQAMLPHTAPDERRTWLFSIYDMLGNFASTIGALFSGSVGILAALGLAGPISIGRCSRCMPPSCAGRKAHPLAARGGPPWRSSLRSVAGTWGPQPAPGAPLRQATAGPHQDRHPGSRRLRPTTRSGSAVAPAPGCWRYAPRRGTSATPCCSGRWWWACASTATS